MRRFRQLYSVILCITTVLTGGMFTLVHGAESSQSSSNKYIDAVGLMKGMGVWPEHLSDADHDEAASRAEFAEILAMITTPDMISYTGASYFKDVTPGMLGYDGINRLAETGIVSGNDGFFNPEESITSDQAAKLLVTALGYANVAEANGGYPAGYFNIASQLKLFDGVKSDTSYLTRKSAFIMLFNALFAGIQDIVSMNGNGNAEYRISDDKTLLSENFDIYKLKGKITENSLTSLVGKSSVGENEIVIGDIRMYTGTTDAESLLGYEVTVYYRHDDDQNINTVIYITDLYRNDVLRIDADDIISYENGVYTYEQNNKSNKHARIGVDADVIYNERAFTFDERYLVPEEGYVELIRSVDSDEYKTVIIHDIKNIVVNTINLDRNIVSAKYGHPAVDFSDGLYDKLVIKDTDGNNMTLDDIFEWDILSYTKSADEKLFIVTVVRDYVTGAVTGVDHTDRKVEIEENEFKLSKSYPDSGEYTINNGDRGDFLLDATGKIAAYVKSESNDFVYGYFIRAWLEDDGENVGAKILCGDRGVIKNFSVTDKIRLDGKTEKNVYDSIKNLSDSVIRYKINSDGKLSEIDSTSKSSYEDSKSSLFVSAPMSTSALYYKNGNVGGRTILDGNTLVFVIPDDRSEYDKYKIKSMSFFTNNYTYAVEAYNTEKEYSYADAVLVHSNEGDGKTINYNTYMAMVENITETIDDDGSPCYRMTYGISNRKETVQINDVVTIKGTTKTMAATSLTPGSVIRIGTDYQNHINEIELLYLAGEDGGEGEFLGDSAAPNAGFADNVRFLYGYVYLTKDGMIKITGEDPSTITSFNGNNTESRILSNFRCVMLDTTQRKPVVRMAEQDDFLDYVHYGSDCVKVIVQTKNSDTYTIMLVK